MADCSIVAALCFGEDDPQTRATVELFKVVMQGASIYVPSLWPVELANSILSAERRLRFGPSDRARLLEIGFTVSPWVDDVPRMDQLLRVMDLAVRHNLTVYDALYVDLARRTGSRLASLDGAMLRAARKEGIVVLGDPA
ncbi:type II toxin-antitoxin system VapC family toxin [Chthonobacter rhizosphaerae]|uniref:type II toxin-antitoxin system VapC family toxin n=1 Tax=Chthonobacter rhizosphaerae TaxID=2735553 RepID=UPI0031B57D2B